MDQIQDLLKQLKRYPNRPDLHNSLGRLYQSKGDKDDASKHFLAAARLFYNPESPHRNLNKAIAILRKMMRDFPSLHDSYYLLSEILEEMDNQEEAIEVYQALSNRYRSEGKHLMAVSVFDKVIRSDPEDMESWITFANLNSDAGMPFHAAQAFVQAASIGMASGRSDSPGELIVKALKLDPENAEACELFRTLAGRGMTKEEEEQGMLGLADELDRNGQYEQALVLLELLQETRVQDKAQEAAQRIRRHSGLEEGEGAASSSQEKPFEGIKVLVVDDEREILLLLEQILSGEGFHVFTARDGQEGLSVYMKERPPLVVTDAMMPKIHGFELCRRIKEESDNTARVMILTAVYKKYKYKGKVQEEYNVDEYLDKPFQITEFLQVFHRMAEGAREAPRYLPTTVPELEQVEEGPRPLQILLAAGNDMELIGRLESYSERKGLRLQVANDSTQLVEKLAAESPDILLLNEALPGIEPQVAAQFLKVFTDLESTTVVLVTRDKSRLEGPTGYFDHRVYAPLDNTVLDGIANLHRSSRRYEKVKGRRVDEKRVEAIVRSKVDRILKSHNQLEEYYSTRVRELEEEVRGLKAKLEEKGEGGE